MCVYNEKINKGLAVVLTWNAGRPSWYYHKCEHMKRHSQLVPYTPTYRLPSIVAAVSESIENVRCSSQPFGIQNHLQSAGMVHSWCQLGKSVKNCINIVDMQKIYFLWRWWCTPRGWLAIAICKCTHIATRMQNVRSSRSNFRLFLLTPVFFPLGKFFCANSHRNKTFSAPFWR